MKSGSCGRDRAPEGAGLGQGGQWGADSGRDDPWEASEGAGLGRDGQWGAASARGSQWGAVAASGAGRRRRPRDGPSGGGSKMVDAAGPSRRRPASAFWARDRILCAPADAWPGRGRRRPARRRGGRGARRVRPRGAETLAGRGPGGAVARKLRSPLGPVPSGCALRPRRGLHGAGPRLGTRTRERASAGGPRPARVGSGTRPPDWLRATKFGVWSGLGRGHPGDVLSGGRCG